MEYSGFFHGTYQYRPLPSYDGFIVVELSDHSVRYYIQPTFMSELNAKECHSMAMTACRIAYTSMDAIRGKLDVIHLSRAMTKPCLGRLQTMQYLLGIHMVTHPELKAKFCYLLTVPILIDGMITSKDTLEVAVLMTISREDLRVNLKLRYIGSRWMCIYADLG